MKTIKFSILSILFISFIFLISISSAKADIPPDPNKYHLVEQCTKIANISNFSDVYLVAYTTGPMTPPDPYIIEENKCLTRGYKFNTLAIYAMQKTYLDSKGIKNIDFVNDTNVLASNIKDFKFGTYVDNSDPTNKEEYIYNVAGFMAKNVEVSYNSVYLFLSQKTTWYNDSTPTKTENFTVAISLDTIKSKITDILYPSTATPAPTQTTNTPTSSPTSTPNPIIKLVSTGTSIIYIVGAIILVVLICLFVYLKKKNKISN